MSEPRTVEVPVWAAEQAANALRQRGRRRAANAIGHALPAPEPQWTDAWCAAFYRALFSDSAGPDAPHAPNAGRSYLKRLYDRGLLVVEREEWERLTSSEEVLSALLEVEETQTGATPTVTVRADEPAPSYSDEEIERLAEVARATYWADMDSSKASWLRAVRAVLDNARPDPAKWVSRKDFEMILASRQGYHVKLTSALAERDEARARIAELEVEARTLRAHVQGHDLRPTEEQVQRWFPGEIYTSECIMDTVRRQGWLRDTEAPQVETRSCVHGEDCPGHGPDCAPADEAPNAEAPDAPLPAGDDREAIAPGDEHYYCPPSIADGTVEGRLVDSLRDLGDAFGPRGVARAAAEMAGATLKTPEEQAVLDAADELVDWWHRGSTAVFTRTERRLVDAVRAYQATKTQEGEG